ncbi:MAG: hypothetical protein ACI9ON_001667 [Limisphaerales bacterium]|jgi:hypothetical protein
MTARLNYLSLVVLLFSGMLVVSSVVHAKPRILQIVERPVALNADGDALTVEQVRFAILEGCTARGWRVRDQGENMLIATLRVRAKHLAEVEIPYTKEHYSIQYLSSSNLDYSAKRQRIHRNYNRWVQMLMEAIDKSILES